MIQKKDREVYRELFLRYHKKLFTYIFHLVGNRDEIEDILQNVFSKTYSRLFDSGEEKGINRRLRESEGKVKMLNNVKDLLSGLAEFMGKLEELEKNNGLNLDLQQGNTSLGGLKEAYIKALKQRLEP